MKPAVFEYHRPETLDAALALLAEHADDVKVLAGGQSLVPLMAMRLAQPAVVIDLGRVPGLDVITSDGGHVTIGAMVRERAAERSAVVHNEVPLLAVALPLIGHTAIRNRGTIGGSLAHADPAAEIPSVVVALDAEVRVASAARGERTIPGAEFLAGFWTSALEFDELLLDVTFPSAAGGTGVAYEEAARRHGDFALVGAGCQVHVTDGRIDEARLVFIGVADVPVRAHDAEVALVGTSAGSVDLPEIGRAAAASLNPSGDLHGSSAYRKHVAGVLAGRALASAVASAATPVMIESA